MLKNASVIISLFQQRKRPIKLNELENKSKDRKRSGVKHSIISGMKASNVKTSGRKRCKKEPNESEINNEDV